MGLLDRLSQVLGLKQQEVCFIMITLGPETSESDVNTILSFSVLPPEALLAAQTNQDLREYLKGKGDLSQEELDQTVWAMRVRVFNNFPLVGLFVRKEFVASIRNLPFVEYVYVPDVTEARVYADIVHSLDNNLDYRKSHPQEMVMNISLEAPHKYEFNHKEAIHVATRITTDAGCLVVVAAGNNGERGNNTLNPWSVAPWVVSVGAADAEGKCLASFSARGIPGSKIDRPTIVAPGIDIFGPFPSGGKKKPDRDARDRRIMTLPYLSKVYGRDVKEGELEEIVCNHTIASGTSQATAFVSMRLVNYLIGFRKKYNLPYDPFTLKNDLEAMAVPIPGCAEHEIGAGFVDEAACSRYLESMLTRLQLS